MSIAIIGPGNMGKGLANLLVAKGYEVIIGHDNVSKASAVAAELGGDVRGVSNAEAAKAADIIILAVHFAIAEKVLAALGDLSGKILVDITNPISEDFMSLTIGHTTSAGEVVAKSAPGAKVVKAFNTVFWQALPFAERENHPPVQVLLAGDDADAKKTVSEFVSKIGFEAIDAGGLTNSRFLEPVGEMNIHFGYALGWGTLIAPSWVRLGA